MAKGACQVDIWSKARLDLELNNSATLLVSVNAWPVNLTIYRGAHNIGENKHLLM